MESEIVYENGNVLKLSLDMDAGIQNIEAALHNIHVV